MVKILHLDATYRIVLLILRARKKINNYSIKIFEGVDYYLRVKLTHNITRASFILFFFYSYVLILLSCHLTRP